VCARGFLPPLCAAPAPASSPAPALAPACACPPHSHCAPAPAAASVSVSAPDGNYLVRHVMFNILFLIYYNYVVSKFVNKCKYHFNIQFEIYL
jgi:hypothetical protein